MASMADVARWVKTGASFSESFKKKVLGSINRVSRVPYYGGAPLEQIPADPDAFDAIWGRGAIRQLPSGFKSKGSFSTWRSQTRSALLAFAGEPSSVLPEQQADAWSQLLLDLQPAHADERKLIAVKVLAGIARQDGISPADITREWVQVQVDSATTSGRYRSIQSAMKLIKAHEGAVTVPLSSAFSGAAVHKSRAQCVRAELPALLASEVDDWCRNRLKGEPKGHRRKRRSACSPSRVQQAVRGMTYVYTAMLTAGLIDPDRDVSLEDLSDPELLEEVIERELNGEFSWRKLQPTTLFEYVNNWKLFVRGCGYDAEVLTEVIGDFAEFENVKAMSNTRRQWCEEFLHSRQKTTAFLALPNTLFQAAQRQMQEYETGSQYHKNAAIALSIAACAAAIWTSLPLRISTLLRLSYGDQDADVQLHDAKRGLVITTPPDIVKNGYSHHYITLTRKQGGDPRAIVAWFVSEVRPRLLEAHVGVSRRTPRLLFGGVSYARLNTIWQNATLDAGVPMTPHQVRHALATLLANQPGADYAIIAALLGDTEATVRKNYVFVDQARKHEEGQKLLAQLQGNVLRRGKA